LTAAHKVPDWVLDGSIKFNGNAGKAADSVGMTSDAENGITLIGLRDTAVRLPSCIVAILSLVLTAAACT
jgi:hypothetical protein